MPKEFPTSPDWITLGFAAKPVPRYLDSSRFLGVPDPAYEDEYEKWRAGFSPEQQAIFDEYQRQVRDWFVDVRERLKSLQAQEYEQYGLEMGINSEQDLVFARNMSGLCNAIERLQLAIEGEEANKQFEDFFHNNR